MTKTKREKGNEFQRWIRDWLTERGWTVHNQAPCGKMIKSSKGKTFFISFRNDIFGCDILARKKGKLLWIQATLDSNLNRKIEELNKYFDSFLRFEELQIWLKTQKGEVNIKFAYIQANYEKGIHINVMDLGKIIRRKFYSCEGIKYEF